MRLPPAPWFPHHHHHRELSGPLASVASTSGSLGAFRGFGMLRDLWGDFLWTAFEFYSRASPLLADTVGHT